MLILMLNMILLFWAERQILNQEEEEEGIKEMRSGQTLSENVQVEFLEIQKYCCQGSDVGAVSEPWDCKG